MPIYAYRAKTLRGRTVTGTLEAFNEELADKLLRERGLYVLSVVEAAAEAAAGQRPVTRRVSRRELILFTIHLSTVFSTGIPLTAGLRDFIDEPCSPTMRQLVRAIIEAIEGGSTLSDAMAQHPRVFSDLYVSLIRSGETSGRLDEVLADLVAYLEWQEDLVRQVRQASIYPSLLLSAVSGLAALLFLFVFPRFIPVLQRKNIAIPLPTRIVIGLGSFLQNYWTFLILGLVAAVVVYLLVVRTPGGRLAIDALKLKIPVVGDLILKIAMSRFAHNLQTLHRTGVDFVLSLEVVERVMGNAILARAVREARRRVLAGVSLTDSLGATGLFPPLVLRMVASGEVSGTLSETLKKVSQFYDREVPAAIKRLFSLVEPLVVGLLAVIVLGSALALYLPIYSFLSGLRAVR